MDTDNKKSILFHKPLQLYPSPWKPESHTHNPSWQNEFGPQGGEHIGVTAKIVSSLLVGNRLLEGHFITGIGYNLATHLHSFGHLLQTLLDSDKHKIPLCWCKGR